MARSTAVNMNRRESRPAVRGSSTCALKAETGDEGMLGARLARSHMAISRDGQDLSISGVGMGMQRSG